MHMYSTTTSGTLTTNLCHDMFYKGCPAGFWQCPSTGFCIPEAKRCEQPLTIYPYYYSNEQYYRYFYSRFRERFCDCPVDRYNTTGNVTCEDELFCGEFHLQVRKTEIVYTLDKYMEFM